MNTMQKIDEAVRITFDPADRRRQIGGLEKRLRLNRVVLLITAVAAIGSIVASALGEQSNAPGIFMGLMGVLCASHIGMALRLIQLKVEEQRDKKTGDAREQSSSAGAEDGAPHQ